MSDEGRPMIPGDGVLSINTNLTLNDGAVVRPKADDGWVQVPAEIVRASLQLIVERDIFERFLAGAFGGEGIFKGIDIHGEARFSELRRINHYAVYMLVSVSVRTGGRKFPPGLALNKGPLEELRNDPSAFAKKYGDLFCSQADFGGELHCLLRFDSDGELYTKEFSSDISASAVKWGLWSDVQNSLVQFHKKESYDVKAYVSGVDDFQIPNKLTVKELVSWVNKFISKARQNTKKPIKHYFSPYAVAAPIDVPTVAVNIAKYKQLKRLKAELHDRWEELVYILANSDEFEHISYQDIDEQIKEIGGIVRDIETIEWNIDQEPFDDSYIIPQPDLPALPGRNYYSMSAVHQRLQKGMEIFVELTNGSVGLIKQNVPHLVWFRDGYWYGYAPDPVGIPPLTRKPCNRGDVWLWGQPFTYNHKRELFSKRKTVKGTLRFVDEMMRLIAMRNVEAELMLEQRAIEEEEIPTLGSEAA